MNGSVFIMSRINGGNFYVPKRRLGDQLVLRVPDGAVRTGDYLQYDGAGGVKPGEDFSSNLTEGNRLVATNAEKKLTVTDTIVNNEDGGTIFNSDVQLLNPVYLPNLVGFNKLLKINSNKRIITSTLTENDDGSFQFDGDVSLPGINSRNKLICLDSSDKMIASPVSKVNDTTVRVTNSECVSLTVDDVPPNANIIGTDNLGFFEEKTSLTTTSVTADSVTTDAFTLTTLPANAPLLGTDASSNIVSKDSLTITGNVTCNTSNSTNENVSSTLTCANLIASSSAQLPSIAANTNILGLDALNTIQAKNSVNITGNITSASTVQGNTVTGTYGTFTNLTGTNAKITSIPNAPLLGTSSDGTVISKSDISGTNIVCENIKITSLSNVSGSNFPFLINADEDVGETLTSVTYSPVDSSITCYRINPYIVNVQTFGTSTATFKPLIYHSDKTLASTSFAFVYYDSSQGGLSSFKMGINSQVNPDVPLYVDGGGTSGTALAAVFSQDSTTTGAATQIGFGTETFTGGIPTFFKSSIVKQRIDSYDRGALSICVNNNADQSSTPTNAAFTVFDSGQVYINRFGSNNAAGYSSNRNSSDTLTVAGIINAESIKFGSAADRFKFDSKSFTHSPTTSGTARVDTLTGLWAVSGYTLCSLTGLSKGTVNGSALEQVPLVHGALNTGSGLVSVFDCSDTGYSLRAYVPASGTYSVTIKLFATFRLATI